MVVIAGNEQMNWTDNELRALGAVKILRAAQAQRWEDAREGAAQTFGTLTELQPASPVFPDLTLGYRGYEFETGPCTFDPSNFWILARPLQPEADRFFYFTRMEGRVFFGSEATFDFDPGGCAPPEAFEAL